MDLDLHPGFQKKKNHETLEKTHDIPKFTVLVQNLLLKKLSVLISHMTKIFSQLQFKDT